MMFTVDTTETRSVIIYLTVMTVYGNIMLHCLLIIDLFHFVIYGEMTDGCN